MGEPVHLKWEPYEFTCAPRARSTDESPATCAGDAETEHSQSATVREETHRCVGVTHLRFVPEFIAYWHTV